MVNFVLLQYTFCLYTLFHFAKLMVCWHFSFVQENTLALASCLVCTVQALSWLEVEAI